MTILIWTIREKDFEYPSDEQLHAFALTLPTHTEKWKPINRMPNYPHFGLERFGSSCHVYYTNAMKSKLNRYWKRIGLFTWGSER
jgi:hypothetical protein